MFHTSGSVSEIAAYSWTTGRGKAVEGNGDPAGYFASNPARACVSSYGKTTLRSGTVRCLSVCGHSRRVSISRMTFK